MYKRDYERLRELKGEIEFMQVPSARSKQYSKPLSKILQMTLEKSRAQLTRDFESWFGIMERQAGGPAAAADASQPSSSSSSSSSSSAASQAPTSRAAAAVAKQVPASLPSLLSVMMMMMMAMALVMGLLTPAQTLTLDGAQPALAAPHGSITGNREADADIAAFYR